MQILNLPANSSLLVFDRDGKQVYISEHYKNQWDGTDNSNNSLPEGTYYYILITPGFNGKYKGDLYLKREL